MSEPKHTNRLVNATSPYLLQHAHNPVDWNEWGAEALERARREEKPIFLSIGYAACHWCHVMEHESFENEAIAALLNEQFVNIKVDREERPDLDDIYMMAVQMMTGSGGWPMSVFLTPDLKPFYAGTYFPPTDRYGRPGFGTLLTQLSAAWRDRRDEVEQIAERNTTSIRGHASLQSTGARLPPGLIEQAIDAITARFDDRDGGFGSAPKFPPAMALDLLLRQLPRLPDGQQAVELRRVVTLTLDKMAQGGMYDQVGGGFHRYSTDARWLVPHFEKMLYDNALLVPVYLEAFQQFGDGYYAQVVRETLTFVLRELTDPEGGFYSTLDADSEGEEGKFYVWSPAEVERVLGQTDAGLFNRLHDITPAGNFEGHSIPHLERSITAWAYELNEEPEALQARIDGMRARLLEARSARIRPGLDDKVLTSWNGLMIRAMARAASVLGDAGYREAAERAASFVLTRMQNDGRLLRTYRDGRAKLPGFHDDYAFFIVGLLDLYEVTRSQRWLDEARRLTAAMNDLFWDEAAGGYFFTAHDHETLIARLKSPEDNAVPSGNSMAAFALVRLGAITGDSELLARAERLLVTHADVMARAAAAFPQMLIAVDLYLEAGRRERESARARHREGGEKETSVAPSPPRPLAVSVLAGVAPAVAGRSYPAAIRIAPEPGWHVNSSEPLQAYLVPTRVELARGDGFGLARVQYPEGQRAQFGFSDEILSVYQEETLIGLDIAVADTVPPGEHTVRLRLRYQPCSDRECLAPAEIDLDLPVRVAG